MNFSPFTFFLLLFAAFGFYSGKSHAVAVDSTGETSFSLSYWHYKGSAPGCTAAANHCTISAAGAALCALGAGVFNGPGSTYKGYYYSNSSFKAVCIKPAPSTSEWFQTMTKALADVCPIGYTGTQPNCVVDVQCPASGTNAVPTGQIGYGESSEGSNPTTGVLCGANQCGITIQHATTIPIGGGQQGVYISKAVYTGSKITGTCPLIVIAPTPNDPTLPKPIDTVTVPANTASGVPTSGQDCPAGSAFGQVNGVNVCSPAGSQIAYPGPSTTGESNGETQASSSVITKEVNTDGSIKTTKTTTASGSGGASSSTTVTVSNSGGHTSLSGTNGTNGADGKDGEQQDLDFGAPPIGESGEVVVADIAVGPGADGAGGAAKEIAVGSHFSASGGGCLADRSVSAMGVTIVIPLSSLCPYFSMIYALTSLSGVFVAMRILVMS
jgi:hypothetical protein